MKGSTIRSSAEEKDPVCMLLRRSEQVLFLNPCGVFFLTLSQSTRHIFTPLGSLLSLGCCGCCHLIWDPRYLFIYLVMDFFLFISFPNNKKF